MPRPTTKDSLLREASFGFSGQPSRTQQQWARDQNLRDVLAHLHEWPNLLLGWVAAAPSHGPD